MLSNHLILCNPLLLLPLVFPSIRFFSKEWALCIRWPKYWSFSFSISPSSEYSGLISFRIAWLNLLAVQGTLNGISSVQFSHSVMSDSLRPHESQHIRPPCPSPTPGVYPNSCPFESVMPSNHLILCYPLLLLPSIFPSIRVFSNESALRFKWPKYWSFSFNISPSSEHSGLIFFRMDWLDLLAVQGTLKSILQHHSSKASILRCSAFFRPTLTSIRDSWKNHSLD